MYTFLSRRGNLSHEDEETEEEEAKLMASGHA